MAPRKIPGPDWGYVRLHYKFLHALSGLQNRALRVRARGLEHVPREGGVLLAANHCAYWDGILLQTAMGRPVGMLVRRELLDSRFGQWFFGGGGAISVDRGAGRNPAALEAATQAILDGRIVAVFPEGKRSGARDDDAPVFMQAGPVGLLAPKSGIGRLAIATGAPVVPIAILTDRFWPRGRKLPDLREPIYLNVGEPLRASPDEAPRDVAERLMRRVGELLVEAHAAREAGDAWPRP